MKNLQGYLGLSGWGSRKRLGFQRAHYPSDAASHFFLVFLTDKSNKGLLRIISVPHQLLQALDQGGYVCRVIYADYTRLRLILERKIWQPLLSRPAGYSLRRGR